MWRLYEPSHAGNTGLGRFRLLFQTGTESRALFLSSSAALRRERVDFIVFSLTLRRRVSVPGWRKPPRSTPAETARCLSECRRARLSISLIDCRFVQPPIQGSGCDFDGAGSVVVYAPLRQ